jgi:uncharacterized membrane protein
MTVNLWIILAGAVLTYATRAAGIWCCRASRRIHPRVQAGLDAVPAAVLTTLVAPAAFSGGLPELAALLVAGLVALRGGMISLFLAGAVVLIALRQLVG